MAIYRTQRVYSWLGKLFKNNSNKTKTEHNNNLSSQKVIQELSRLRPDYRMTPEMKEYISNLGDKILVLNQNSGRNLVIPYGLDEILDANRCFLGLKDSIIIASTRDMNRIYAAGNDNVGVAWKRNQDGSYYVEGTVKDFKDFV